MSKLNSGRAPRAAKALSGDSLPRISRRRFAREAAVVAAAPFAFVSQLPGEAHASPETSAASLTPQENILGLTPDQTREVDAKLASAVRQFADRLSDEQRQRLRRILLYNEKMLASIRAFHLENGDPPASAPKYFGDSSGAG